jgi:hypothetical protein
MIGTACKRMIDIFFIIESSSNRSIGKTKRGENRRHERQLSPASSQDRAPPCGDHARSDLCNVEIEINFS